MIRRYLAAPKVGLVAEDDLKSGRYLADRQARDLRWPGFWALKREIAGTAR